MVMDFTEGRLAPRNDPRNPWTTRNLLPFFIELDNRVLDRFPAEEPKISAFREQAAPLAPMNSPGQGRGRGVAFMTRMVLAAGNDVAPDAASNAAMRNRIMRRVPKEDAIAPNAYAIGALGQTLKRRSRGR
jgi:hypothetical protein